MIAASLVGIIINVVSATHIYQQKLAREIYADRVTKVEAASKFERFINNIAAVQNTFSGPFVNFQAGNGFQLKNANNQNVDLIDESNSDLTATVQVRDVTPFVDEQQLITPYVKVEEKSKWNIFDLILPSAYAIAPPINWAGMYTLSFMVKFNLKPNAKLAPYWDGKHLNVPGEVTVGVNGATGQITEVYTNSSLVSKRNQCRANGKLLRFTSNGSLKCGTPQNICAAQGVATQVCANGSAEIALACSNSAAAVACPAMGYFDPGACTVDADCPAGSNELETAVCNAGTCQYMESGCGNGIVEGFEQCDNGALSNGVPGDSCDDSCNIVAVTAAQAVCGNGLLEEGEECDSFDTDMCDAATCVLTDDYQDPPDTI